MTEALKWLAENLEEVALDQEAEGFDPEGEGVPMVPISSCSVEAMDNSLFQNLLRGIGIQPPNDEQVHSFGKILYLFIYLLNENQTTSIVFFFIIGNVLENTK